MQTEQQRYLLCKVFLPVKVSCFVWLMVRKTCLAHKNLQRRGFQILFKMYALWSWWRNYWTFIHSLKYNYKAVAHVLLYFEYKWGYAYFLAPKVWPCAQWSDLRTMRSQVQIPAPAEKYTLAVFFPSFLALVGKVTWWLSWWEVAGISWNSLGERKLAQVPRLSKK